MRTTLLVFSICGLVLQAIAAEPIKSEVELQAEPIGINYSQLAAAARKGHPEALRVLLALRFDGGGGEMFQESWRPAILRELSDETLSSALSDLSTAARREIVGAMTAGIQGAELVALQRRFPKSFAAPTTK